MSGSLPAPGPGQQLARTRSFARRGDRMKASHQAAYDRLAPTVVLDVPREEGAQTTVRPDYRLDVAHEFGRKAPLVVEVGSGSGDALRAGAAARPDWDFLAFEVWRPGTGQALARMGADVPSNLRFVEADAAQAMASLLPPGSVHEVWTFFPDPWPKTRHHKRRLVNPPFLEAVAAVLEPGGLWRLATDWAAYAEHMRTVLDADQRFHLASTGRAPLRPVTRFEAKGVAVDREITDLAYRLGH